MKNKIKKWHIALMSFMALFIAIFASLFSLNATTVDEEETPEELIHNWEISTVFYDSSVDNGKTPLTSINWDASDGGYGEGISRVITVQINYKNDSAVTTYPEGELKLTIPNLLYGSTAQCNCIVTVGANDSTHTGYDWNYVYENGIYTFTNTKIIEEKSNFEGSIQIIYDVTPAEEVNDFIERYSNECTHSCSKVIQATLDNTIKSNELNYNYLRIYKHPWQKRNYSLEKTVSALNSMDGIPSGEYFWVKYTFTVTGDMDTSYPYIGTKSLKVTDTFPDNCIVLNSNLESVILTNNIATITTWTIQEHTNRTVRYNSLYVGYPKSEYNETNNTLDITNTAELYAYYESDTSYSYICNDTVSLNLDDFQFVYNGDLYGVTKSAYRYGSLTYQAMTDNEFEHICAYCYQDHIMSGTKWSYSALAIYTGSPMTVKFGDDLLYITDANGNYRKLNDNEYYIKEIALPSIKNMNNITIPYNKYNISLYVKYSGDTNYSLYTNLANYSAGNKISFKDEQKKVIAFYIQIDDMEESLVLSNYSENYLEIHIKPIENIATSGTIYNFDFIQVYFKNSEGDLICQNIPSVDSYATFITKEEIAQYDQTTYGAYLQRATASRNYVETRKITLNWVTSTSKSISKPIQDAENEKFTINHKLGLRVGGSSGLAYTNHEYNKKVFFEFNASTNRITGYRLYDLMPEGMEIVSTPEEIINSLTMPTDSISVSELDLFYDVNGDIMFTTADEFNTYMKTHTTINIIKNWNNTGRTKIEWFLDFTDAPIFYADYYMGPPIYIDVKTEVSYDSFLEYGNVYTNYSYAEGLELAGTKMGYNTYPEVSDNGTYDSDAYDINENGIIETLTYRKASVTIVSVISTHQDVTTYVQTDQSNYSTGIVDASNNSEYEYKLRVRTGSADVTNLVIYSSIEEAQPNRTRWKGKFLSIDTSYAKNKGYNVKSYYSENPSAGNLYNENGTFNNDWKEYIDETTYKEGLMLTFNNNFKTENIKYDYIEIYYKQNGKFYNLGKWGGTDLAGQTVSVPTNDFYLYWHTDGSSCSYYGFSIDSVEYTPVENNEILTEASLPSYPIEETTTLPDSAFDSYTHGNYGNSINKLWHYTYSGEKELIKEATDKTKVKSLAFEYLDAEGNPAVLPANSLTYVLIKMKAPADESIKTLARMDCWTQWNAIDEFDRPVDFITGINSNVVKVALPNSVKTDDLPSISLKFTKEIQGETSGFENLKLNKSDEHIFMIRLTSLTTNDDGTYNQVTGLLSSTQGLVITQIPIGTYLLEELGDNYFDFVEFTNNNDPEIIINGVTFERTDQGYIITVSEDLTETIEFNIKVTNEIEPERFYEDKNNKENLFLINKTGIDHNVPEE